MIDHNKPPLNEALKHYGVKGMKWGQRKAADLSGFSNQETVLQKGTKIQNLSPNEPRKLGGPIYVTHTPKDNLRYRGQFSWVLINRRQAASVYQNSFTAKSDIKIASERQSVEAFMAAYKKNPKQLIEDTVSAHLDLETTKSMWGEIQGQRIFDKEVRKKSKKLLKKGEAFVASSEGHFQLSAAVVKDIPSRQLYFQELAKMGFQGVIDQNDARAGAEHPVIIFDGKQVLASGQSKNLTANDINLALSKHRARMEGR